MSGFSLRDVTPAVQLVVLNGMLHECLLDEVFNWQETSGQIYILAGLGTLQCPCWKAGGGGGG